MINISFVRPASSSWCIFILLLLVTLCRSDAGAPLPSWNSTGLGENTGGARGIAVPLRVGILCVMMWLPLNK